MSFKNTKSTITMADIQKYVDAGLIKFDSLVQRGTVWNIAQKSLLIHSIAIEFPIPQTYAKKISVSLDGTEEKGYDFLDGKQRVTTIAQYLSNMFKLDKVPEVSYLDGKSRKKCDMSGKKFSELPEALQDLIRGRTIDIVCFDDANHQEEVEAFIRLNNGKPLSSKSKAISYCVDIEHLLNIGKHQIFNTMLTKKRRENKEEAIVIMKMYLMLTKKIDDISFRAKEFNAVLAETKVTKENEKTLKGIMDYSEEVYNELIETGLKSIARKYFYKEVHYISLIPFIKQAIDSKITFVEFAKFIGEFFSPEDKTSVSDDYNLGTMQGTSNPTTIKQRHKALEKEFKKFFA